MAKLLQSFDVKKIAVIGSAGALAGAATEWLNSYASSVDTNGKEKIAFLAAHKYTSGLVIAGVGAVLMAMGASKGKPIFTQFGYGLLAGGAAMAAADAYSTFEAEEAAKKAAASTTTTPAS